MDGTHIENLITIIKKYHGDKCIQLYDVQDNKYQIYINELTYFRINDKAKGFFHNNFDINNVMYLDSKNVRYDITPIHKYLQKHFFKHELTEESILKIEKYCFEVM